MKGVLVKLTEDELALLDRAIAKGAGASRADVLRHGLYQFLSRVGYGFAAMRASEERQANVRRRRSQAVLTRDREAEAG